MKKVAKTPRLRRRQRSQSWATTVAASLLDLDEPSREWSAELSGRNRSRENRVHPMTDCPMNPFAAHDPLQALTRRHFFSRCALGPWRHRAGVAAGCEQAWRGATPAAASNPMAPKLPHFPPRAKNIIYLFMAGGPSQLELFDYKPKLIELNGQPIPQSFIEGKRFAFMGTSHGTKLLGTRRAVQTAWPVRRVGVRDCSRTPRPSSMTSRSCIRARPPFSITRRPSSS